jgi:quercetin dioxygenase-like cupin family protein
MTTTPIALVPAGGEQLLWLGEPTTIKITGEETDGHYALVEVECTPEGFVPLHVHHREDEAFYVVDGEITFRVGDETFDAGPGSFVFGPRGVPHAYTVNTPTARMLMQFSPAGFEGFIRATSGPAGADAGRRDGRGPGGVHGARGRVRLRDPRGVWPVSEPGGMRPYLLASEASEKRWFGDTFTWFLATGDRTGDAFALVDETARRGESVPLHRHPDDPEAFYVLDGELTFWLGDEPGRCAGAGAFAFVPAGAVHGFRVESDTARYLILTTPRLGEFFRAITLPSGPDGLPRDATVSGEQIGRAVREYGIERVGSLPEPR